MREGREGADHAKDFVLGFTEARVVEGEFDGRGDVNEREGDVRLREALDRATAEGALAVEDQAEVVVLLYPRQSATFLLEGERGGADLHEDVVELLLELVEFLLVVTGVGERVVDVGSTCRLARRDYGV